ncbi:MAG: peptidylprolyl isomerase [Phycisphaerae bacterium]|nr:peptidylprolyl isomerase [Phycisphaerae bacterium]
MIESLEDRKLMASTFRITSISADNRGEVVLQMNQAVNASTVSASSVLLYTAGADGKLGTSDDVRQHFAVTYDSSTEKITLRGRLDLTRLPDTGYRVRVLSTKLLSAAGQELDGEFKGSSVASGNGRSGGDCNFRVEAPSGNPEVRISTSEGTMTVQLYLNKVKTTVQNFLRYANDALYDNTIYHRSVPSFVIQAGGYSAKDDSTGLPAEIQQFSPIALQALLSNTRGTVAMARTSNPNSATSQFFFNTVDNSANLNANASTGNNGYAVFGAITSSSGLATMDKIARLPTEDLTPSTSGTAFETVPDDSGALVVIRRIAVVDKIVAI